MSLKDTMIVLILVCIGILLIITIISFFRSYTYKYNFKKYCHRYLYRIAQENDFFLINNIRLQKIDHNSYVIDHILGCEKFIFLIKDYKYHGVLTGKEFDEVFRVTDKKGQVTEVPSPLQELREIRKVYSLQSFFSDKENFVISIALVNNDALPKEIFNFKGKNDYICPLRYLSKIITYAEKRDEHPIDQKTLEQIFNTQLLALSSKPRKHLSK